MQYVGVEGSRVALNGQCCGTPQQSIRPRQQNSSIRIAAPTWQACGSICSSPSRRRGMPAPARCPPTRQVVARGNANSPLGLRQMSVRAAAQGVPHPQARPRQDLRMVLCDRPQHISSEREALHDGRPGGGATSSNRGDMRMSRANARRDGVTTFLLALVDSRRELVQNEAY